MIEGLKPYAEYKESGLSWLDRIPRGWDEQRSKYLFREVDQRSITGNEMRLSMSQRHGLIPTAEVEEKRLVSKTNIGGKICEPGDLVLNRLKAHLGVFALAPQRGIVSPDYTVFRSIGSINGRYFCTLYRSPYCGQELRRTAKGIVEGFWRLYTDQFYDIRVPVPPPEEQAAIVRFLDHANWKVDGFIRAKRKLIALLNEQKQAIIHRAVMRGLNPDVQLKPSGIPWLGDIPAHWDTPLNQRIFRENIRPHNGRPEIQLSLSQRDGLIATSQMQERSLQTSSYDNWKVTFPGDLVLNRFKAHLGVFFCATLRGIVSFHYGVFAPQVELHTKYFELLFHTTPYKAIYAGRSNGMTVGLQNLSNQNFYGVRAIVPPVPEQAEIIAYAENATADINKAIARIESEIALMQEYRTRLTADIVTGKLDVRVAAAKLPQTEDEPISAELDDDLLEEVEAENEADG